MNPNLPTIIALILTVVVLGGVIAMMVIRRKKGKTSCSCGCGGCAMRDVCHSKNSSKESGQKD